MRFGVNTFLYTSPFTNKSVSLFPKFKKWGFDSVEIAMEDPANIDPAYIKKHLDKHGLVCGSMCAAMGPGRDLRGTLKDQRTAMKYFKDCIKNMEVLGCTNLSGPIYSVVGRAEAVEKPEYRKQWATVKKHLKELAQYAGDRGITVGLEPLNRFETDFINTVDQALDMINQVNHPALGIHLDTFHMNVEEKDLGKAIRKAGKKLVHIHTCGSDRGTPGNDHTDWKGIGAALKAVRYKGDIVIESFTTDVKVIARAAAIWRRIEPTRDEIARDGVKFLKKALA